MDYPYTAIFGRGVLNKFEMVVKRSYLCMKMPSPFRITTIHGDQAASRKKEGKAILGYSLINEVAKKLPVEETKNEKAIRPRAEAGEDSQKAPLSKLVPESACT